MDAKAKIARSAGIVGDQFNRWVDIPPINRMGKDAGRAVFYLEGPIVGSATSNYFDGEPTGFTTPKMLRDFLADNEGKEIEININSPGGSVFDANSMVSELMQHDGDVRIVVSGACFSAAADFLGIPDTHRVAMAGSMVMVHNAWTFAAGDAQSLQKVVNRLIKMNGLCADRFAQTTRKTKDELIEMMNEETWMTDAEAMDAGFVDEVYDGMDDSDADETEVESMDDDSEQAARSVDRANDAVAHRLATIL